MFVTSYFFGLNRRPDIASPVQIIQYVRCLRFANTSEIIGMPRLFPAIQCLARFSSHGLVTSVHLIL